MKDSNIELGSVWVRKDNPEIKAKVLSFGETSNRAYPYRLEISFGSLYKANYKETIVCNREYILSEFLPC